MYHTKTSSKCIRDLGNIFKNWNHKHGTIREFRTTSSRPVFTEKLPPSPRTLRIRGIQSVKTNEWHTQRREVEEGWDGSCREEVEGQMSAKLHGRDDNRVCLRKSEEMGQEGRSRVQGSISTYGSRYSGPGRELSDGPGSHQYKIYSPWEVSEVLMSCATDSLCHWLSSDPHVLPVDGGEGTAETDKKVEPGQDECLKTSLARSLHKSRNNSETRPTFPSEFASGSVSSQDKRGLRNVRLRGFRFILLMMGNRRRFVSKGDIWRTAGFLEEWSSGSLLAGSGGAVVLGSGGDGGRPGKGWWVGSCCGPIARGAGGWGETNGLQWTLIK